jgi:hypothetical protein
LEKVMSIEKSVLEKLLKLPVDKQKEVLDFVENLEKKIGSPRRRRSLKGLWADLGAEVSSEDIVEARREIGGGILFNDVIMAEAMPQNLRPA